jgi:hypothetical protein
LDHQFLERDGWWGVGFSFIRIPLLVKAQEPDSLFTTLLLHMGKLKSVPIEVSQYISEHSYLFDLGTRNILGLVNSLSGIFRISHIWWHKYFASEI